jgi:hypothetical protein
MAKVNRFVRPGIWVESSRNWNGRHYIAWKPNTSQGFSDRKSLLRWVAWPAKTPTGDELRVWLDELEAASPSAPSAPVGDANVEASFDPLAHGLDESDPQHATRTII